MVFFVLFDDFKKNPETVYKQILKFLEVDQTFKPRNFNIINQNRVVRSRKLRKFFYVLYNQSPVSYLYKKSPKFRFLVQRITDVYWIINSRNEKRPPMPKKIREKLIKEFEPEIKKISKITKKNLSLWLN
jgi:hypothetical protein